MNFSILPVFLSVLCGFLVFPVTAGATAAQDELKRFVDGVQTLSAKFTQVQMDEHGKVLSSSAGKMWLARPGRFRWTYEAPYQQLIVSDGYKIWLYDQDLSQVTVRPAAGALKGTPAALLSQRTLLNEAFTLEDGGSEGKLHIIRLKPKSEDSDFKAIMLWLDNGTPARMQFFDQLGGATDVSFAEIKTNQKPDDALFRFTPPKGTEVIDTGTGQ